MVKTYGDYINDAFHMKKNLDLSIANKDTTNIVYYRGKYISALKQAYRLNPNVVLPSLISNLSIEEEIKVQLDNHQNTIDTAIKENKVNSDVKKNTLSKEIGLRIRGLSTAISKLKMATTEEEKKAARKDVTKASLKLGGTALKTPVMAAAKLLTILGPLMILIIGLPATLLASGLSFFGSLSNGKEPEFDKYTNTPIHQMSSGLQNAVKSVSAGIYNVVGRL